MNCTLYVAENCHECGEVVEFLEKNNIEIPKVNVDQTDLEPPIKIYAFPALFEEGELVCYGSDIETYLKRKSHNK